MALSSFIPNPGGPGGTIEISLDGQVVAKWNATNEMGNWVPNGTYYFVAEITNSGGTRVILKRAAFVMTYHNQAILLTAMPNLAHSGETIHFFASFGAAPADERSGVKIYAVSGELVQTLAISGGATAWDLTNRRGQIAASGVYLAVLDGEDPVSGLSMRKVVKLMVIH